MEREDQKMLNYWIAVEIKYRDKKRSGSEETHYQHALDTINKLSPNYGKSITNDNAEGRIRRVG